jgi:hypothetical protein
MLAQAVVASDISCGICQIFGFENKGKSSQSMND